MWLSTSLSVTTTLEDRISDRPVSPGLRRLVGGDGVLLGDVGPLGRDDRLTAAGRGDRLVHALGTTVGRLQGVRRLEQSDAPRSPLVDGVNVVAGAVGR